MMSVQIEFTRKRPFSRPSPGKPKSQGPIISRRTNSARGRGGGPAAKTRAARNSPIRTRFDATLFLKTPSALPLRSATHVMSSHAITEVIVNRILVVEDDRAEADFLKTFLGQKKFAVDLARDGGQRGPRSRCTSRTLS